MFLFVRQSFGISRFVALHAVLKKTCIIIVPPPYIRAAGSDNRTRTHRRPSTIFFFKQAQEGAKIKFTKSHKITYQHWSCRSISKFNFFSVTN